jgi:cell division protein FtsI (penicillin-binding protein 3)
MSRVTAPPRRPVQGSSSGGPNRKQLIRLGDPRKRGIALLIITAVVLTLFAGRLVDLQAIKGSDLASAALDQRLRTVAIPALRGEIVDTNGAPLAVTVEARDLTADQTLITDPVAVGVALAPILGADAEVLTSRLIGDRRFMYVAKGLTPEIWRRIEALRLPGIFGVQTSRRIYPGDSVAANVVGFMGADGVGLAGLEYKYEDQLAGTVGTKTYERGPGGKAIPTAQQSTTDATAGVDIRLTIDRDIQYIAQEAIQQKVWESGADSGTVVVMDPRSGQILAIATEPTYDSNKAGSAPAGSRGNRALSDIYEPGSTSKIMTLAAVIDQGAANPYSTFTVPGSLTRGGKVFHDHNPHGTLRMTLAGIMAKSSNIGTILASERIGGRKLLSYLKKFGIGEKTGIDFPGESTGRVPAYKDWSATSFPTIAFGQGLSVNSVQAASVFATIANDGVRIEPTLVASITRPDGTVEQAPAPKTTRVVSPETAVQVRAMLESVVGEGGTAPMAAIPGYRVGGKTGTAQYVNPATGRYGNGVIASFIGMAPADNPQLVVAVNLVNPRNGRFGGELAGPVFKTVMSYALQARHIPPTGTKAPKLALMVGGNQ